MLVDSISVPAVVVLISGAIILWSNPRRGVNRAVFTCSVHTALWLSCAYVAAGHVPTAMPPGVFWLRLACAIGTWIPYHLWCVKETIVGGASGRVRKIWFHLSWIITSTVLSAICFTEAFIPRHSTELERTRGWGYYLFIAFLIAAAVFSVIDMLRDIKTLTGAKRLELQLWLGGGCAAISLVAISMALNAITKNHVYISTQPYIILGLYAATGYAITTYKIFDAHQILRIGTARLAISLAVGGLAYGIFVAARTAFTEVVAFLIALTVAGFVAGVSRGWLDRKLRLFPQANEVRKAAFAAARKEARPDSLERAFVELLKGWAQTEHAIVLSGGTGAVRGSGLELAEDSVVIEALRRIQWVTPERLAREKGTPERAVLSRFLSENNLGVVAISATDTLIVLAGAGVTSTHSPYTYPQVLQLIELNSIFEGAFERARLALKMQHAEQLATVGLLGASLAHEIRNPLVTIKTFVQLLPTRHEDKQFRDKFFRLMGDEISRIDRLTEQLLDLASPRTYSAHPVELHAVLQTGFELIAGKAKEKSVQLIGEFEAKPDTVIGDPGAIKQVVLNLCLNAIQALEARTAGRWVRVSTRNVGGTIEMAVSDNGSGISPTMQSRLFQPFQSSKSSGFGLGLAICRDILTNLGATISIDPPQSGSGATFRVVFPCPPLLS